MSDSSSISTSTVNGVTRITGLASGLDVDSIVEKLMVAEREKKYNKLEVEEQTAEWTQTAYRSVTSKLQDFSSSYFSTTASTSIMKASNFLSYNASSSDAAVSVTAAATASAGSHRVSVTQLATAAKLSAASSISKEVEGDDQPDYQQLSKLTDAGFVLTLDGTKYTVDVSDVTDLSSLQDAIDNTVGSGKVTVSKDSTTGHLEITADTSTTQGSGVQTITLSAQSSSNSTLTVLGFGDEAVLTNRLSTSDTLKAIAGELNNSSAFTFDSDGVMSFTINGATLTVKNTDTLADMISEVNDADLGVTMAYDSTSGALTLKADDTGAGDKITLSGSDSFASMFSATSAAGTDAEFSIDGKSYTRSTNSITVDGVTYTLNQKTTTSTTTNGTTSTTDTPATVTVAQDTDGVYKLISNFVDAYNTLIASLNSLVSEDKDSDYTALTDDQKDDMTDDEISSWEAKAKVGLLENDSIIEDCVSDMREALIGSISGLTTTLSSIGITTGDYSDNGKLEIDEDTLKSAIASDPEAIMNLFTQQATSKTSSGVSLSSNANARNLSASDANTRYKQEGIAYRIYDILQKNISTTTDNAGNEGLLIEKAGITDDTSDTDNALTSLIDKYSDEIDDEKDRLDDYEDKLYDKYTSLETYINQMNTQLSSLSSMTGS